VVGDRDRLPAVDIHVAHHALECRAARLALESLALDGQAGLGANQAGDADTLVKVQGRLGVLFLGQQDGFGRELRTGTDRQERRLVISE